MTPTETTYKFKTDLKKPKLGIMLVGLGGNNGTTLMGGVVANREGITWKTKEGVRAPDYFGSLTQSATCRVGSAGGGATVCLCGVEWGGRHGGATPWVRGCRGWTLLYLVAPRRDVAGVWAGDGVLDRLATPPRAGHVLVFLRRRDVRGLTTTPPPVV